MSELHDLIVQLDEQRAAAAVARLAYNDAYLHWQYKHASLIDAAGDCKEKVIELEAAIRDATIAAYQATGDKRPAPGVAIRIKKRPNYLNFEALDWAIEHNIALQLDQREFERIMLATDPEKRPAWFLIHEYPEATIATDISKALQEVGS